MNPDSSPSSLPARIARLDELAGDLWWAWHADARSVFRRLDYGLWRATAHNPLRMVRLISREKLDAAAADPEFLDVYDRAMASLDAARAAHNTWWTNTMPTSAHLRAKSARSLRNPYPGWMASQPVACAMAMMASASR